MAKSSFLHIRNAQGDYKENPIFTYNYKVYDYVSGNLKNEFEGTFSSFLGNPERVAFYLINYDNADSEKVVTDFRSQQGIYVNATKKDGNGNVTGSGVGLYGSGNSAVISATGNSQGRYPEKREANITTNIPIFETLEKAQEYVNTGEGIEDSINYEPPTYEFGYFIYSEVTPTIYDLYGNISAQGVKEIKNVRFVESNERLAFYKNDDTLALNDLILQGNYKCEYTTDNIQWVQSDTSPFTSFMSRTVKKGNKTYNVSFRTNIPIFEDVDKATLYVNGNIGVDDALNYDDLTKDDYKKGNIGEEIEETENGVPYNSNIFAQQYILSKSALVEIGNSIYSTNTDVIDSILEGTRLFGGNSMNCIIGLQYYPIDVNTVTTSTAQNHVTIGSYMIETENTVNKVVYNNKMLDCGNAFFSPIYNDFRDFEPYTTLYVYLPYIGVHNIDISKYLNKNISLKYAIDVSTGMCSAFLYGDSVLLDTFDGRMAIEKPITSVDQMQYISSVAEGVIATGNSFVGALSGTIPKSGANEISAGVQGLQSVGGALSTITQGFDVMQTAMDLPIRERGTFSPTISEFAPQYPYFIFAQCETVIPQNEQSIVGYPSNIGGNILSFSGFLKCSNVKLNNINLTEKEKSELETILKSGVYL